MYEKNIEVRNMLMSRQRLQNISHQYFIIYTPGKTGAQESPAASYYRQPSADIKMKHYKIKTSYVSPDWPLTILVLFFN